MRRTTSEPALTNSSLPTLNAPAIGASCSTSLSATSGFGTSNATIIGLCMRQGLSHGRHADGIIFNSLNAMAAPAVASADCLNLQHPVSTIGQLTESR